MKRIVKEADFAALEERKRKEIAEAIKSSGLDYTEIGKQCGVDRRSVRRLARMDGDVRWGTRVRVEYLLTMYNTYYK